jgi:hypothetical protein
LLLGATAGATHALYDTYDAQQEQYVIKQQLKAQCAQHGTAQHSTAQHESAPGLPYGHCCLTVCQKSDLTCYGIVMTCHARCCYDIVMTYWMTVHKYAPVAFIALASASDQPEHAVPIGILGIKGKP